VPSSSPATTTTSSSSSVPSSTSPTPTDGSNALEALENAIIGLGEFAQLVFN
jgi:hypothetical protein